MERSQPFSHQPESSPPLNLGLSVKERMAAFQKQSQPQPSAPKVIPAEVGVSVRDRAKTLNTAPLQQPVSVAKKEPISLVTTVPKPVAADLPSSTSPSKDEEPVARMSIKDRINMYQGGVKPQSSNPVPFKPALEISGSLAERKAQLGNLGGLGVIGGSVSIPKAGESQGSVFDVREANDRSEEEKKGEGVRTGTVAEIAGKIQTAGPVNPFQPRAIDIGVSIQEKKQLLQQQTTAKPESADRIKADLVNLPSVEARKSLITTSKPLTDSHKEPIFEMSESLAERKAKIKETMDARLSLGPMATIPIITGTQQVPTGEESVTSVTKSEVEKPVIKKNVMRRAADFDQFD